MLWKFQTDYYIRLFIICFHVRVSIFIFKQMYNINGLQKVCDILLENPSWTIAHLVAYFNLTEHINNSKVINLIDQEDSVTQMTPFQVSHFQTKYR